MCLCGQRCHHRAGAAPVRSCRSRTGVKKGLCGNEAGDWESLVSCGMAILSSLQDSKGDGVRVVDVLMLVIVGLHASAIMK